MKSLSIMIVEDDALLAALIRESLTGMGHRVCATEATEAAAEAAAARLRPDLVLVDVRLGDGDGRAAMAAIARTRPVPHVYVTGRALDPADLGPGAVLLRKPFSERLLAQAIDSALAASPAP